MLLASDTAAIHAAIRAAGDLFLPNFRRLPVPQTMPDLQARLADIEARCLAALQGALAEAFPNTPWLAADEFALSADATALPAEYWLCDAMDGAIQYVQQLPGWTINLVLMRQAEPIFAAIYDPLAQELFWAQAGAGAFVNEAPLHPSTKREPGGMVAVFEHTHGLDQDMMLRQRVSQGLENLLGNYGVVRNYGPHGLQLAYIGAGRLDVFLQVGRDLENWLPGLLIAREAGAEVLTAAGQPWHWAADSLLVTAPGLGSAFVSYGYDSQ
ncbi:inositol monophosphatase family protein [Hymenobacter sp. GOD-10R]|uniref:inositol monophosphatase family protein n=1 Tax=Hymenobacter sp. GOD-10R TaxID=3093922 RepID=UPI002D767B53|nr:inositol monophosphatase family protein [Hymenobacter sp. GOD-10R]WRQ30304.1 inositol monophosphatase family protein [Hymenobacter sp. GOD-10R]